jgi:hypothetical protein
MRHPSKRLVTTFIISLIAGFGISWLIMVGVLDTTYRQYGFTHLSTVAILAAILLTGPELTKRKERNSGPPKATITWAWWIG